jgi:FAD/FMN-containing dehydrogenase
MTKQHVVKRFYDNEEQYNELQKLKLKIDPTNLFSSIMTVKLPIPPPRQS